MPWWGWVLIIVVVIAIVPLKIKVWKMLLARHSNKEPDEDE
ncbi:MAG TPA: hypothetical protein VLH18_03310 [Candidatus Limnocylindrales bacterium]|nr:hypothetical protein [Candidatus Limnocylindrales bacterium]